MLIGYETIALTATNADKIANGAAIQVYAIHVVSTDIDVQIYDGAAAYDAGTTIAWFHRSGNLPAKFETALNGMVFKNGCYIESDVNTIVTVCYSTL